MAEVPKTPSSLGRFLKSNEPPYRFECVEDPNLRVWLWAARGLFFFQVLS